MKKHVPPKSMHKGKTNNSKKFQFRDEDRIRKLPVAITCSLEDEQFKNEQDENQNYDYGVSTEPDYADSTTLDIENNKARDSGDIKTTPGDEPNDSGSSTENTIN